MHNMLNNVTDGQVVRSASQWYEMYCHDLEVMSSNPSWVELEVRSTFVYLYLIHKQFDCTPWVGMLKYYCFSTLLTF